MVSSSTCRARASSSVGIGCLLRGVDQAGVQVDRGVLYRGDGWPVPLLDVGLCGRRRGVGLVVGSPLVGGGDGGGGGIDGGGGGGDGGDGGGDGGGECLGWQLLEPLTTQGPGLGPDIARHRPRRVVAVLVGGWAKLAEPARPLRLVGGVQPQGSRSAQDP